MKVLIACERSGMVGEEFVKRGHDVTTCDLMPTDSDIVHHYQGDIMDIIQDHHFHLKWDLMIAHPYCTHTAVSGARWFKDKIEDGRQQNAIKFFMVFVKANCNKIAIEHPISIMSTVYRKPDQIIQPWMFGHGETKATCLWLKNLPLLKPTKIVQGREARVHKMAPSQDRAMLRSRTYTGIAKAMAEQWGSQREAK